MPRLLRQLRELNVRNRDPKQVNSHIAIQFEDVIAEPPGARSLEGVWRCSFFWYTCCYRCGFRCFTLCCGVCCSIFWGCRLAFLSFWEIYFVTPNFKCAEVTFGKTKKLYSMHVHCILDPICEAFSLFFKSFNEDRVCVQVQQCQQV